MIRYVGGDVAIGDNPTCEKVVYLRWQYRDFEKKAASRGFPD